MNGVLHSTRKQMGARARRVQAAFVLWREKSAAAMAEPEQMRARGAVLSPSIFPVYEQTACLPFAPFLLSSSMDDVTCYPSSCRVMELCKKNTARAANRSES